MLIIGRAIQGVGGGGINMMIDLIVCDIVPLRERGNYLGIIFAVFSVGTSMGPFIGGVLVTNSTWRWVFYINLPIGGVALVLLIAFLHVNYKKESTLIDRIMRIDFIGNAILIASVVAILFATAYGGTRYAWSSWRIIVPLVLGFIGMGFYQVYESSNFCLEPTTPPRLFSNKTSSTAYFLTFVHALLTVWVIYFLPLYFQAVLASTAARSGVQLLPTVIVLIPLAAVSGILISKTGRYKPLHLLGFALMTLGFGLFTLLDSESSISVWVIFQIFAAAGSGLVVPALLRQLKPNSPKATRPQQRELGLSSEASEHSGASQYRWRFSTIDSTIFYIALAMPPLEACFLVAKPTPAHRRILSILFQPAYGKNLSAFILTV